MTQHIRIIGNRSFVLNEEYRFESESWDVAQRSHRIVAYVVSNTLFRVTIQIDHSYPSQGMAKAELYRAGSWREVLTLPGELLQATSQGRQALDIVENQLWPGIAAVLEGK